MRRRLDNGRREELLDGVIEIVTARGFSQVRTADMARELHCSESTLYKIAPSKDSLVVLAIGRWGALVHDACETRARQGKTSSERARVYFRAGAESLHSMSRAFRSDVERFESARLAYRAVSERFIDRFVALLDDAVDAGEIERVNTHFLARVLRQMALVVRDEEALKASGLTAEQAVFEIDRLIWEGMRTTDREQLKS